MSALTSGSAARTLSLPLRSPLPKAAPKRSTPLRLVPQRRSSAAKAPFVLVVVTLLVGGLLGLLLLNTLVAQDSFQLHDLGKQGKALAQQEEDLSRQVQALQAPGELAARASALGMVPGNAPAFLRLSDGKVLGVASAGAAPVVPVVPKSVPKAVPAAPAAPAGSTTWTAPRQTPPPVAGAAAHKPRTAPSQPTTTGAHR
jgi:hypothetical protein